MDTIPTIDRRTFLRGAGATLALPLLPVVSPLFAKEAAQLPEPRDWRLPLNVEYNGYNGGKAHSERVNGAVYTALAAELEKKGITLVPSKALRSNEAFLKASGYIAPEDVGALKYAANLGGRYQASQFTAKEVVDDAVLGRREKDVYRYRIMLHGNYTYNEGTSDAGTVQQAGGATGETLDELANNAVTGVGAGQKLSFSDQLLRQIGVYTLHAYLQGQNPVNGIAFRGGDPNALTSETLFRFVPQPFEVPVERGGGVSVFSSDSIDVTAGETAYRFWAEKEGTGPQILGSRKTRLGDVEVYRALFIKNPLGRAGWVRDMVAFKDCGRIKVAYIAQGSQGQYSQVGVMDGETGEVLRTIHHKYGNFQKLAVTRDPVKIMHADGTEEEIMVLAAAGLSNLHGNAALDEDGHFVVQNGKLKTDPDGVNYTRVLMLAGTGTGSLAKEDLTIEPSVLSFPDSVVGARPGDVAARAQPYGELGYFVFSPKQKGGVSGLTVTTDEKGLHAINVVPGGEHAPAAFSLPLETLLKLPPKERLGGFLPARDMARD